MRKGWLLAPVMALLLVLGIMSGAVLANTAGQTDEGQTENGETGNGLADQLITRLAEQLDTDEQDVEDAMVEVFAELSQAHNDAVLDHLVERDRLSDDEAEDIRDWYEERPDALDRASFFLMLDLMGHHMMPQMMQGMSMDQGDWQMDANGNGDTDDSDGSENGDDSSSDDSESSGNSDSDGSDDSGSNGDDGNGNGSNDS